VSLHGSLLSAAVVAELRERVELVMTWGVNDLRAGAGAGARASTA
jgi:hypothetical protein